jgi:hypothetical protein
VRAIWEHEGLRDLDPVGRGERSGRGSPAPRRVRNPEEELGIGGGGCGGEGDGWEGWRY